MREEINNFLNPKSIAIIGASDHIEKVGGILLKKALKSKAKIIPVNPSHEKLFGIKCYKSVLEYEKDIDLALIAIPAPGVAGALEECGKKKIKSVVIISAGFSEIGNIKGEELLLKIANQYGIRIVGPNCFGVCNPYKNLDTTFSITTPKKGNIAFLSQSGALWSFVSDFISDSKDIGFSGFVSLGNMAQTAFGSFIEYFSEDKKTKSIILYMERLRNGNRFVEVCKKCKKPIYAIKAGKTQKGSEAAYSHTASLASDYDIYKGVFKQAGVILCSSLEEALEKASKKIIIKTKKEKVTLNLGKKVFIVTNAGGAGALLSDYLSEKEFEVVSNPELGFKSPWDILGTASGSDYFNALEKLKDKTFYDSIIVLLTPQSMSELKKTAEVIVNFKEQTGKPIVPMFLGKKSMKVVNKIFKKNNIPYFNTLEEFRRNL